MANPKRTDDELDRWNAYLEKKALTPPACRWCGGGEWSFRGVVGLLAIDEGGNCGPGVKPMATITCSGCYHTEFFSWIPIVKEQTLVVPAGSLPQ